MSIDNYFSRFQEQRGFKGNLRIVGIILVLSYILATNPPILAQKGNPDGVNPKKCPQRITNSYPPAFDWRCVGGHCFVSPVKDQGNCASCTAFAVTATLESIAMIQHFGDAYNQELANLSETTLFFCNNDNSSCSSCSDTLEPNDALRYCRDTGLISTTGKGVYKDILKYCATNVCNDNPEKCQEKISNFKRKFCNPNDPLYQAKVKVKITDYGLFFNPISIKEHIATKGPVIFIFACEKKAFLEHRGDGIIKVGGDYFHSVSCIGYDDQKEAWLCKNSMGEKWGDKGFFWLAYLEDDAKNYESLKAYYIDGFVEVEEE